MPRGPSSPGPALAACPQRAFSGRLAQPLTSYRRAMKGPRRSDGATARARLEAALPRWIPTEGDVVDAAAGTDTATNVAERPRHTLPERPGPMWRLGPGAVRGLVSLTLAAVAGGLVVVVAGWPRGSLAPEAAPTPEGGSVPQNVLMQPSPVESGNAEVIVDVDGAVRRPGVVTLPDGSRVIDAIEAAGGSAPKADTEGLNLAQVLMDGEQVVVPRRGLRGQAASGVTDPPASGVSESPGLVNLNTATATELEELPGIGPVLAAAIVDWRTQNGGFTSVEQLEEVSGIGPTTFAELAPLVRV